MNKLRSVILISFIFLNCLFLASYADTYSFKNDRIQKEPSNSKRYFTKKELAEIAHSQDQQIAHLKSELIKNKKELNSLKKELKETIKSFERFKNFYFRRY